MEFQYPHSVRFDLSTSEEVTFVSSKVSFLGLSLKQLPRSLALTLEGSDWHCSGMISPENSGNLDSVWLKQIEACFPDITRSPSVGGDWDQFGGSTTLGLTALRLFWPQGYNMAAAPPDKHHIQ